MDQQTPTDLTIKQENILSSPNQDPDQPGENSYMTREEMEKMLSSMRGEKIVTKQNTQKTAKVAIAGKPNAGKSTLLNNIMHNELAIVTPKEQTTRFAIKGILDYQETQLVLIDTPGLFQPRKGHNLEKYIVKNALNSIKIADIILFLVDIMEITRIFRREVTYLNEQGLDQLQEIPHSPEMKNFVDTNRTIMKQIRGNSEKFIFAVNKCDLYRKYFSDQVTYGPIQLLKNGLENFSSTKLSINSNKQSAIANPITTTLNSANKPKSNKEHNPHIYPNQEQILQIISYIKRDYDTVCNIAAASGDGVPEVLEILNNYSKEGEWEFNSTEYHSDMTPRKAAEEITREQVYLQLSKELPYSICVSTESWEENEINKIVIRQAIYVLKDSQKTIVIGKNGQRIKEIGIRAREKIAKNLGKEVSLFLFVKTKPEWINRLKV